MGKKILIPIDFRIESLNTLKYALEERKQEKSSVILMYSAYNSDSITDLLFYNPTKIVETLPSSEFTAYSENKGDKIAFCLDTEKNSGNLIDDNTLTFVGIHEIAHIATESVGHTNEFWTNFKFLLQEASKIKIYIPEDYKKKNKKYCGMELTDNPYFDF